MLDSIVLNHCCKGEDFVRVADLKADPRNAGTMPSVGYDCEQGSGRTAKPCHNRYAHKHCTDCGETLNAIGGGGDDGRCVGGYEDDNGNTARACATCSDSILCRSCAIVSKVCVFCLEEME